MTGYHTAGVAPDAPAVVGVVNFGGSSGEAVGGIVMFGPMRFDDAEKIERAFNEHPRVEAANEWDEISAWTWPIHPGTWDIDEMVQKVLRNDDD